MSFEHNSIKTVAWNQDHFIQKIKIDYKGLATTKNIIYF